MDAVRARLAASSTNVPSALGSANNPILVDGDDVLSSGSRSVSAGTAGACGSDTSNSDARSDVDIDMS